MRCGSWTETKASCAALRCGIHLRPGQRVHRRYAIANVRVGHWVAGTRVGDRRACLARRRSCGAELPAGSFRSQVGPAKRLGFPILLRGEVLGVLEFFSREIRKPDNRLLEMLSAIGSQIGQFMERAGAEAALRVYARELETAKQRRRRGDKGQERISGQHEPRNSHADERHHRHDRTGARHPT